MSEIASSRPNKLWTTPLRDLLRGRITGRLDWKSQLASLPGPAAELIVRVVKRTRLWRLEKAAVAGELISHFRDGLDGGTGVDELVRTFGDERSAAKLIRRAKRRARPLLWHAWIFSFRTGLVLLGIYAVLVFRFWIGEPNISVDYIARLNAATISAPMDDRAWPIWRQAILAASDAPDRQGYRKFAKAIQPIQPGVNAVPWPETANWLDQHTAALDLARQAAQKPDFGFIIGRGGMQNDPELTSYVDPRTNEQQPLLSLPLPFINYTRYMADMLSFDARHAAELHDRARVEADLAAMHGLARQLRNADGLLITQFDSLGIDALAIFRFKQILADTPDLFSDDQLIRFAHAIAGPRVAADLINLDGERYIFDDIVQRVYTDDGNGDGRLTLKGMQSLRGSIDKKILDEVAPDTWPVASPLPAINCSRADLVKTYDHLLDQARANFESPLRRADWGTIKSELEAMRKPYPSSPSLRYWVISWLTPDLSFCQAACERYLGERDGAMAGIALEIYHRRRGNYPVSLSELTPTFLPEIPADRITGDPVRYRLIDGKPEVYSWGGLRPPVWDPGHLPAQWDKGKTIPNDWVLYPPTTTDGN